MPQITTPAIPALDIEKLTEGVPRGSWVAISAAHDRVVAYGPSVDEAVAEAASQGETAPLIVRVPESAMLFL